VSCRRLSGTLTPMTTAAALLTDTVLAELGEALERGDIQLALAYHAWREKAQYAATARLVEQVAPLLEGRAPTAPSAAARSLRAARALLAENQDGLSSEARGYLEALIVELDAAASNRRSRLTEERELRRAAAELDELSASTGGVYVYTFPHYWWNPSDAQQGLHLLRVGAAPGTREGSIFEQARAGDMPEEQIVLRFYPAPDGQDPFELAGRFHELLDASGHERSRTSDAEAVWFLADLDTLDLFAYILGLVDREDAGLHIIGRPSAPGVSPGDGSPAGRKAFLARFRVLLGRPPGLRRPTR
jgi:hypothetical protein